MVLRRDDVVEGALALLDREGIDRLTTRRLGASLQVEGTALYRHFPTKEALLDAIADRLVEGVGAPIAEGSWDEQLTLVARRLRRALLGHRDGARIVAGTYVSGPHTSLVGSVVLDVIRASSLPAELAGQVAFALGHFVLGHCIEEQAQRRLEETGAWVERRAELADEAGEGYARTAILAALDADPDERFALGVALLIDGVRALVERA